MRRPKSCTHAPRSRWSFRIHDSTLQGQLQMPMCPTSRGRKQGLIRLYDVCLAGGRHSPVSGECVELYLGCRADDAAWITSVEGKELYGFFFTNCTSSLRSNGLYIQRYMRKCNPWVKQCSRSTTRYAGDGYSRRRSATTSIITGTRKFSIQVSVGMLPCASRFMAVESLTLCHHAPHQASSSSRCGQACQISRPGSLCHGRLRKATTNRYS